MSQLLDLIKNQVAESISDKLSISDNQKNDVFNGVSSSIFDSIKQTASEEGGIGQLMSLFTGKTSASASPVSALAASMFKKNIASKLGLSDSISDMVVKFIPVIIEKFTKKANDDDGIDVGDLLSSLGGGSSLADGLKKAAGGILGGLFK
ncbi:MAG: hypothetical protein J6R28_05690 [Bacteroides sp.]|jgi:hypothetical protein|nr:hypothetical protein [Bacteroides sp.]MBQ5818442.1 hypothetical protein [Bacteroides sp.]MBR0042822.1 hypothetical protein [Bacteroides sp.]